jgi:Lar family restriction alleviation protein
MILQGKRGLKPCPFCGLSNAVICSTGYERNPMSVAHAVSCRTADCHGVIYSLGFGLFKTKGAAKKAWNTRAKP